MYKIIASRLDNMVIRQKESLPLQQLDRSFRPMQKQDLSQVLRVEHSAYHFPWSLNILIGCLDMGNSCWVYEVEGTIRAHGILQMVADEGHILNMCVEKSWQGRGIGKRLLKHLISIASNQGVTSIYLEVRPSNQVAFQMYRDAGFSFICTRKKYYRSKRTTLDKFGNTVDIKLPREDAWVLSKLLTQDDLD